MQPLSTAQRHCLFALASSKLKVVMPWYGTTMIVAGTAEHVERNTVVSLVRLGYLVEKRDKLGRKVFKRLARRRKGGTK